MKTTIYVLQGETMLTLFKLNIQMQGVKNVIIFLVVGNNKTAHAPTSKDCYFSQLKFFKNFDYRYCLLTIYTSQQQFYLH